jgi:hypothetical protein
LIPLTEPLVMVAVVPVAGVVVQVPPLQVTVIVDAV